MNSLRHLSDELLKESLKKAIELKLDQDFCATLKNEIKKRKERGRKPTNTKTMNVTSIHKR
ncbi:sporulation histidine kinase inhibitor Sda [Oceanobacillus sp. FSL K6-2867]|uniref:sporulation histidine kinase inhibitor Sda n=1 Tax=Oceanobacillus sp. FSL K6-2867 TaxID=2954748 RepID=UPI0030D93CA7